MKIGNTGLQQVCMVTWDLKKSERHWTAVLGQEAEHLKTPPWQEVPSYSDGKPDDFSEEFILYRLQNDVILEIFGPGKTPNNPWRRYLDNHGAGVMNLAFYVEEAREKAYAQIGTVCSENKPYHVGYYPDCTYSFVNTSDELGVELNIKRLEDNIARICLCNKTPEGDYETERKI